MGFSLGIVGLPNVGKSTLFNAVTKAGAEASNYPFCTIDPNVGIVSVPDERLHVLTEMSHSEKTVPTAIEFVDIAGLVKGASQGEGLGNKFLANIREVKAIIHVVRCFEDDQVIHVDGAVDPVRDIEVINTELILADSETVDKRIQSLSKKAKGQDAEAKEQLALHERLKQALDQGMPLRQLDFNERERVLLKQASFLTMKDVIYAANVAEDEVASPDSNPHVQNVKAFASRERSGVVIVSAKIEEEIAQLSAEDADLFLTELGMTESGLDQLIKASYDLLGLITFLTTGPKESRAWTIRKGLRAPQAAGVIHTDFERGFIKAEVIAYSDLVAAGSMHEAKESGKVRQEGKDYVMKDGDVVVFKFNV